MSRNGAGTYVLPAGQPVVTGTTISSTVHNTLASDIANALTTSIATDGQSVVTANIPFSGYKLTGIGAATVNGDAVRYEQVGALAGSQITALSALTTPVILVALRSYLSGCGLSTAGSSATMSIAAGAAMDSTNAYLMQLSAIAKTTSAWAVGTAAGGLDTGAIANNTGYHFFVIRRPDTGVVDVLFSLSASAPTLPANYTQFRRIGWAKTNGSAQWTSFIQDGDFFQWLSPPLDVSTAGAAGTSAVLRTLTTPGSVNCRVQLSVQVGAGAGGELLYLSDPSVTDQAPVSGAASPLNSMAIAPNATIAAHIWARTNTSSQIRTRQLVGSAAETLRIVTIGWVDTRGRDA